MKKSKKFIMLVLLISIVVQGLMGNITYSQTILKIIPKNCLVILQIIGQKNPLIF